MGETGGNSSVASCLCRKGRDIDNIGSGKLASYMLRFGSARSKSFQRSGWISLVILLAIASLSVSLATRTFRLKVSDNVTIQSAAVDGMRQHLDRDAVRWLPPVTVVVQLDAPTFYPRVAPAAPPLPGLLFEESLYNRPPPVRG